MRPPPGSGKRFQPVDHERRFSFFLLVHFASVCAMRSVVDGIYVVRSSLRLSVKGFASTNSGISESVESSESVAGPLKFSSIGVSVKHECLIAGSISPLCLFLPRARAPVGTLVLEESNLPKMSWNRFVLYLALFARLALITFTSGPSPDIINERARNAN